MACKNNQNSVLGPSPYPRETGGLTDEAGRGVKIGGMQNNVIFQCHMLLSYSFAFFSFAPSVSICPPPPYICMGHPKVFACVHFSTGFA